MLLVAVLSLGLMACGGGQEPTPAQNTGSHRPDYVALETAFNREDTDAYFRVGIIEDSLYMLPSEYFIG